MYYLHLFENIDWHFPNFPSNSYSSEDYEKILNELKDVFTNPNSGVNKILINIGENTTAAQNIMNL